MKTSALLALAVPLALAALTPLACSSPAPSGGTGPSLHEDPAKPAPPTDHPPLDPAKKPVTSAAAQRLSVEQLRGSYPVALGTDEMGKDITWSFGGSGFDKLAGALGEADFSSVTEDNLEPSPLYLKFMDDAARDTCGRVLTADAKKPDMATHTIYRFVALTDTEATNAAGFDQNLRYLKLRLHGIKVPAGDDAPVAPLRALFSAATKAAAGDKAITPAHVKEGWRAVCVALLTAPEFHLY